MMLDNCGCEGTCAECSAGLGVAPWVQNLITTGVETTSGIFKARYGVPPAGTSVIQENADGRYQVLRAANHPGFGVSAFPQPGFGINTNQLLVFGGLAIAGILAVRLATK